MKKEIYELAESIYKINKIRCELFKEDTDYIISNVIQDNSIIERTLDTYFDLAEIPQGEKTYLDLCKYYEKIDKEAADFYYNCYLELVDNEPKQEKCKTKKLGNS